MSKLLTETGGAEAVQGGTGGQRREITIIQEGWGSSGYYSQEVLERDGPRIFPVGTHMYIDHPTVTERAERPERSIKDLAATLVSTPRMKGISLVAEAEIKEHWVPVIDALAEDIGTSIIAEGVVETGKAGGREGPIVKALTEGHSVDFVTKAGAGGKVGKLIESASAKSVNLEEKRNAANWLEARIHARFTETADMLFGDGHLTREERIGLSSAIGEALTAFNTSVESNLPGLLSRDPFAEAPTGDTPVEESNSGSGRTDKEDNMSDKDTSELSESVRKLTGEVESLKTRVEEAEAKQKEAETRAERAEDKLLAQEAARVVGESIKDIKGLPPRAAKRVIEAALGEDLPVDKDGKLIESELKERAKKAAREEQEYLSGSKIAESASGGTVVEASGGSGGSAEEDKGNLVEAFRAMGMSEDAAKIAAEGR